VRRTLAALAAAALLAGCGGGGAAAGGPTTAAAPPAAPATAAAPAAAGPLRYVALGDSYSSGEGLTAADAWPVRLAGALAQGDPRVELVLNAARPGWTSQQALEVELVQAKDARPDVATVMIGANDAFQNVPVAQFQERLRALLAGTAALVGDPRRVVVVTIPDYRAAPSVVRTPQSAAAAQALPAFAKAVADEAARAGMPVADIADLSRAMGSDPSLVLADGLHPSAKELDLWTQRIVPVARQAWAGAVPRAG
jgi:lysophospholipase L1-like esterase